MKDLLPGWKTNINTAVLAITPILALLGIQIDPATVTAFLDEFSVWLQGGFALLGGLGIYLRSLASRF